MLTVAIVKHSSSRKQRLSEPTFAINSKTTPLLLTGEFLIDDGIIQLDSTPQKGNSVPSLIRTVSDDLSQTWTGKGDDDAKSSALGESNFQNPIWIYYPPDSSFYPPVGGFYPLIGPYKHPPGGFDLPKEGYYPIQNGLYSLDSTRKPPNGAYYNGTYYPLNWANNPPRRAYYPNWCYYAPSRRYYPPSWATNAQNDPGTDTEGAKIDERSFTLYFKSLGALQNAWIVVVSGRLKKKARVVTSRIPVNKDILETVANVGQSITAIFALVISYKYSPYDKTHKKLDHLHAKLSSFIVSLQDAPGLDGELQIIFSAFTNFQINFNQWTPCISAMHLLLFDNFVKLNAEMESMIANMYTACMSMKAKSD
jgi:hypothetical protein